MNTSIPARVGRTECETPCFARSWLRAVMISALGALGCGVPVLSHLDGRPFATKGQLTTLNGGWAALDQCEIGVHILVEFEVPEVSGLSQVVPLDDLLLRMGNEFVAPTGLLVDGPFCAQPLSANARGTRLGFENHRPFEPTRRAVVGDDACETAYLVRAEFELSRMPQVGDHLSIVSMRDNFLTRALTMPLR